MVIKVEVIGKKLGVKDNFCLLIIYEDIVIVMGMGIGGIVELILFKKLNKLGVWFVENSLFMELFEEVM